MKKQVIAVLTSLVMAATMIPAVAFADTTVSAGPKAEATTPADQVKQAVEAADVHEVALASAPTGEKVGQAVKFIATTDAELTAIAAADKASWTAAKAKLEAQLQGIADIYRTKVNALNKEISLDDMAAVQEVYLLKKPAEATEKLTTAAGQDDTALKELAESKINALKTLVQAVKEADKDAFTKKVSQTFAVSNGRDFTFTESCRAQLALGESVFSDHPSLADIDLTGVLNGSLSEYDIEKANYNLAKKTYDTKETAAKTAANTFIDAVETLSTYDVNKADYNLKLNKAKDQYAALDPQYKESGRLYKDQVNETGATQAKLKSVRDAKEQLDLLIGEANSDNQAILRELVEGIDKLPATVTLADKDIVYTLQKRASDLTEAGKQTFKNVYKEYSDKLDAAIAAMDKLVTDDVKAQITALKALPATPTLKDIEAAKEAAAAVRAAYEALTANQKKMVTNEGDLTKAETAAFTAEAAYAKAEMNSFSKLDAASLTEDQASEILQLQERIDKMGKTYKDQVMADPAYKLFQELAAAAKLMLNKNTNLESAVIEPIPAQTYTGKAITPKITVKDASGAVIDADNYDIAFDKNVNAGTAVVTVTAKGSAYIGEKTASFTIKAVSLKSTSITVANKTYTGKALKPAPTVKLKDNILPKSDYKVTYKNDTKLGKATATIKGTGNCTGTVTKTFLIKPAKATVTLVRSKAKQQITVSAKEQKTATAYQVLYNTKGTINKTAKSAKRTITIKKLKSGKTYTVRVRVCKKIDGKNYWGAYSPVYKVKVR